MSSRTRFVKSVIAVSKNEVPQMPWARGTRRAAYIRKRSGLALKNAA